MNSNSIKYHQPKENSIAFDIKQSKENKDNSNQIYIQGEELESDTNRYQVEDDYSGQGHKNLNEKKTLRKKKKPKRYFFSFKYTVFLITIWLIFLAAFIVGFILRFDVDSSINASTILWCFSAFILVIAVLYTCIYHRARKARNDEEMQKYLKLIPF
jgi:hypothetical protein